MSGSDKEKFFDAIIQKMQDTIILIPRLSEHNVFPDGSVPSNAVEPDRHQADAL